MSLSDKVKGQVPVEAKTRRCPVLGDDHNAARVRYIHYMANHRYPITRTEIGETQNITTLGHFVSLQ